MDLHLCLLGSDNANHIVDVMHYQAAAVCGNQSSFLSVVVMSW